MNNQNVYTDVQMEILRHVDKYGVLPHGVNHDDVATLTKGYLIRLAGVSEARVMLYRLRPGGSELLKEVPAPTDTTALKKQLTFVIGELAHVVQERDALYHELGAWASVVECYIRAVDCNLPTEANTQLDMLREMVNDTARKALEYKHD